MLESSSASEIFIFRGLRGLGIKNIGLLNKVNNYGPCLFS